MLRGSNPPVVCRFAARLRARPAAVKSDHVRRFVQGRRHGEEQEPHGAQPDVQGAQAQHQEAEEEQVLVPQGGGRRM